MGYSKFSFLLIFCFCLLSFSSSIPHPCRKDQSISLLKFKISFTVNSSASVNCSNYNQKPSPKTNSWTMSRDCCSWDGVTCDEMTGHVIELDLSCSQLVGKIDSNSSLFQLSHLQRIDLSCNNFSNSEISPEFGRFSSLTYLDLSTSYFSGRYSAMFGDITALEVLDMCHNNLSGNLPTTFSNGSSLRSLNLQDNKLEGKIPRSLANCKELQVLDLGDNQLLDTFPMWLGTLPKLQVLSLRSNKLHGPIQPSRIETSFPELRIIDLSCNGFSGNLPMSLFQHLKSMRTIDQTLKGPSYLGDSYYHDSVTVSSKGLELELVRILTIYTNIDLSNNIFEGYIPSIMGDLIALRVLNLSHNRLQGPIPPSLGNLFVVESLDLSGIHLVGEIPAQFASLTALEVLNLSYNHVEGCIPQGNKFHIFENNSYEGNDGLRGFPLSKGCGNDGHDSASEKTYAGSVLDEESNSEFLNDFWKAALLGYGTRLCIGLSIIYILISTGNMKWLERTVEELEHNYDGEEKEAAKAKELQKKQ
ncbi:hypothetical protein P3S68_033958 [Capsicum galapagoense]